MGQVHIPHLETNITIACQRRCTNCNHFVPMQVDRVKASQLSPETVRRDLTNFSRIAHTDAWAAIGGEPLLHPQLAQVLAAARESLAVDTKIEVWSNGQKLTQAAAPDCEFYHYDWDTLIVSAYPGVLTDIDLNYILMRCNDHGKTFHLKDERAHPNFTQLLVPRQHRSYTEPINNVLTETRDVANFEAVQVRYDRCWFKTYSRVLDNGVFYRCCTSPFIPELLQGRAKGDDGLRLTERTTADELRQFLEQRDAMTACESCAGRNTPEAVPVPWTETKDPDEWRRLSGGGQ